MERGGEAHFARPCGGGGRQRRRRRHTQDSVYPLPPAPKAHVLDDGGLGGLGSRGESPQGRGGCAQGCACGSRQLKACHAAEQAAGILCEARGAAQRGHGFGLVCCKAGAGRQAGRSTECGRAGAGRRLQQQLINEGMVPGGQRSSLVSAGRQGALHVAQRGPKISSLPRPSTSLQMQPQPSTEGREVRRRAVLGLTTGAPRPCTVGAPLRLTNPLAPQLRSRERWRSCAERPAQALPAPCVPPLNLTAAALQPGGHLAW